MDAGNQVAQQSSVISSQLRKFVADASSHFEASDAHEGFLETAVNFVFSEEVSLDRLFQQKIEMSRQDRLFEWLLLSLLLLAGVLRKCIYIVFEHFSSKLHYWTKYVLLLPVEDAEQVPIHACVTAKHQLEEFLTASKLDQHQCDEVLEKFDRAVYFARRRGSTNTTVPSSGTGQIQMQFEGTRVIAIAHLWDMRFLGDGSQARVKYGQLSHYGTMFNTLLFCAWYHTLHQPPVAHAGSLSSIREAGRSARRFQKLWGGMCAEG